MIYLKNNGLPSAVTVYTQREVPYMTKAVKGKFKECRIVIGMYREEHQDPEVEKFRLREDEKVLLFYIKRHGKWIVDRERGDGGRSIRPLNYSFVITHYPHLVGFKLGRSEYDEREYNILCGQIAQIENEEDAKVLFEQVGYLDQVDEKGVLVRENKWRKDREQAEARMSLPRSEKVDLTRYPKSFEPYEAPGATPKEQRIKSLTEDREMPTAEPGEKIV